jgi:hypothetical protein
LLLIECFLDVDEGVCDFISNDALEYFLALLALESEELLDTLIHMRHICIERAWRMRTYSRGCLGVI